MLKPTLLLSQSDIEKIIDLDEVIETVEAVFRAHGEGKVIMPAKITLDMSPMGSPNWINAMPAYLVPFNALGLKWVGGFLNNSKYGLPFIMATIILNDPKTGFPEAVIDGMHITNMRTGAVTGICAKYFAKKDSSKVGIIGCGAQGRTSLMSLAKVMQVDEVRAYDIIPESRNRFVQEMAASLGLKVIPVSDAHEACEGIDIIVTATQADKPIVKDEWFKKGGLIVSLGSYQELQDEVSLRADKIVVDSLAQCSHRGELVKLIQRGQITEERIYAEVSEVVAGAKPGRENNQERIVVVPIGLGSHDIAVAKKVCDKARKQGIGQSFSFITG